MFRQLLVCVLAASVQLSAAAAPLMHRHADAGHDSPHHHGVEVHAHFSDHASGQVGSTSAPIVATQLIGAEANAALNVDTFVAVSPKVFDLDTAAAPVFVFVPPFDHALARLPRVAHATDPPQGPPLPARAPPHSLSPGAERNSPADHPSSSPLPLSFLRA